MAAQCVYAAARSAHISKQELSHRCGAYDLRTKGVLRPPYSVDDRRHLLHVAIFSNGREEIVGLQQSVLRNAGDFFYCFRRVSRVLLLQQLKNAPWMLERQIVGDICREQDRSRCTRRFRACRTACLMAVPIRRFILFVLRLGVYGARTIPVPVARMRVVFEMEGNGYDPPCRMRFAMIRMTGRVSWGMSRG